MILPFVNLAKYDPSFLTPAFATAGAGAIDLRLSECARVKPGHTVAAHTGLYLAIPEGYAGLVLPRSGLGAQGLVLANTVGLIDSDYRGEIVLMLHNRNTAGKAIWVEEGTRAAQMVLIAVAKPGFVRMASVDALSKTDRGTGGFGSSGVK
jgi:dUTP pyrophosphatase